jgi:hypothetical protein
MRLAAMSGCTASVSIVKSADGISASLRAKSA